MSIFLIKLDAVHLAALSWSIQVRILFVARQGKFFIWTSIPVLVFKMVFNESGEAFLRRVSY